MRMKKYEGFDDWNDVKKQFEIDQPEPEAIYASYDGGGWDGSATVFFRDGDQYFTVDGSHCSCYGLEGQWDPEPYTKEQFINALKTRSWYHAKQQAVNEILKELES